MNLRALLARAQPVTAATSRWTRRSAEFCRRAGPFVRSERFQEFCSVTFVVVLATVMLWRAVRGDWPVGHDHPVHLFRIWQLNERLAHHATLWTWSHRWFAGYPANVIYPVGADLFVLIIRALTLGKLSFGATYGLALWMVYALYGYAVYFFVSRALGSRLAAAVAVVFLLTDAGNNDVGGWFWLIDAGVWTAALGMVPALIGTIRVAALLEAPTPRTAAAVAICFGLAVLCHPLHLIYFALAVSLLCAIRLLTGEKTAWLRALSLLAVALTCGLLIASFWLVPYLAAGPYLSEVGAGGNSLTQIGEGILDGKLFPRMYPLATAFGFVGALCLLRARRTRPLFTAAFVFIAITLSSSSFAHLFGASAATWLSKHIVLPRLLMLAKPFWYGAAGFLLVASARVVQQALARRNASGTVARGAIRNFIARAVIILMICAFVLPIIYNAAQIFIKNEVLRPTRWNSERKDLAARAAFVAWAKAELPRQHGFFRIVHGFDQDEHNLTDLAIDVPYPFYKIYTTPSGHFKYSLGSGANEVLRAVNVRYALTAHAIHRPDLRLVQSFGGQLMIYEFRDWNPNPFEISGGAGQVKLLRFRDEEIVLRANPGAHGLLRLNVSYFPKWHATRDGVSIPINVVTLPSEKNSGFMQVPLAPGTYRFRYEKAASDYVGTLLCLVGLIGTVFLMSWQRVRAFAPAGVRWIRSRASRPALSD